MLQELPDHLLLSVCAHYGLGGRDLAHLERCARHFRLLRGELKSNALGATIAECAAEDSLSRRPDAWRVAARRGESYKRALHVLEMEICPFSPLAPGGNNTVSLEHGELYILGQDVGGVGTITPPKWRSRRLCAMPGGVGRVVSVACGGAHSLCLSEAGQVSTWGAAGRGQLGHDRSNLPFKHFTRGRLTTPTALTRAFPERVKVAMISAGAHHSACVTDRGGLWTWGLGDLGQLGHGTNPSADMLSRQWLPRRVLALRRHRVVSLECGSLSTAVLASGGSLWMCGWLPTAAPTDENPAEVAFEAVRVPTPVALPGGVPVEAISCGFQHFAAIGAGGQLHTWGKGGCGALGHGDRTPRRLPTLVSALRGRCVRGVSCGKAHTAAVTDSGELWTWGDGHYGQLGQPGSISSRSRPGLRRLPPADNQAAARAEATAAPDPTMPLASSVTCGESCTFVTTASGVLACGDDRWGQLGLHLLGSRRRAREQQRALALEYMYVGGRGGGAGLASRPS
eukprot:COSAG01_NODE_654_length_14482_cov_20.826347_3_plen_511_part_00